MDKFQKSLRSASKILHAGIIIGKQGVTAQTIENIVSRLKTEKIIKIKLLPSAVRGKDKKKIALELASKCNAQIIDTVGFTVTLCAEKKHDKT